MGPLRDSCTRRVSYLPVALGGAYTTLLFMFSIFNAKSGVRVWDLSVKNAINGTRHSPGPEADVPNPL